MKKKLLSIVLAAVMLLSLLPATALAADAPSLKHFHVGFHWFCNMRPSCNVVM